MALKNYSHQLNWRQILMHFIAFWFFVFAFQTLAYLYDVPASKVLMQSNGGKAMTILMKEGIATYRVGKLMNFAGMARVIGLLTAFVISLIISFKQKWFWGNSVIALLLLFFLGMFRLLGWSYLKYIFLTPGEIISNNTVFYFLTNGLVMLILGTLTFFLSKFNQFISKPVLQPTHRK